MQIEVRGGDILDLDVDGLVIPTNSLGTMVEGIAARARERIGAACEEAVTMHAPIAVGAALVTGAGPLRARSLIHAPLLEAPGTRVSVESIRRATRASLLAATAHALERIAIPGMGYGDLGVSEEEASRAIIDEVRAYKGATPVCVLLVDEDPVMCQAFSAQVPA